MRIRPFMPSDEDVVIELWRRCGLLRPWNDPHKDILRKLSVQPEWFLVGTIGPKLVASLMAGFDGHRGWINYLAVDPGHQRRGYGRAMMAEAERLLRDCGCPKINLQLRRGNQRAAAFYERVGFSEDPVVSFGKRLIADDG